MATHTETRTRTNRFGDEETYTVAYRIDEGSLDVEVSSDGEWHSLNAEGKPCRSREDLAAWIACLYALETFSAATRDLLLEDAAREQSHSAFADWLAAVRQTSPYHQDVCEADDGTHYVEQSSTRAPYESRRWRRPCGFNGILAVAKEAWDADATEATCPVGDDGEPVWPSERTDVAEMIDEYVDWQHDELERVFQEDADTHR